MTEGWTAIWDEKGAASSSPFRLTLELIAPSSCLAHLLPVVRPGRGFDVHSSAVSHPHAGKGQPITRLRVQTAPSKGSALVRPDARCVSGLHHGCRTRGPYPGTACCPVSCASSVTVLLMLRENEPSSKAWYPRQPSYIFDSRSPALVYT